MVKSKDSLKENHFRQIYICYLIQIENNKDISKVIYDEDLSFRSDKFKRWLLNNKEDLSKYQITFSSKDIWSQK